MSANDSEIEKGFEFIEAHSINGIQTEFVVHKFMNKILLIITQFGKIGNFYSVNNQVFSDDNMISASNTKIFNIKHLFGPESIETEGAIRYLMNFIASERQEILVCFAVKNNDNLSKEFLDRVKDILLKIPIFMK
ncbi:CLUMA_CG012201, isoform A [Clunio marinus]|uniref:CLUMA_CG012201, isoform A n=1 Tax=Clunio marinus TaxID=568069 RepID=A0A1J1IFI8_9DIPT|nr:CLUMA_CG012201, isoform A [Clunio marinus]